MKIDDLPLYGLEELRGEWSSGKCPRVYGPIQSRRHGLSIGINLGNPSQKICNWSCLYCQCGLDRRQDGMPEAVYPLEILNELNLVLMQSGPVDSVTIAGNSEPGLYPFLKELVEDVKLMRKRRRETWIFNALSNGSMLWKAEVRKAFENLDEVWLKLDCGEQSTFTRLNNPSGPLKDLENYLKEIQTFPVKKIQTLLWHDESIHNLGNDSEVNLRALLKAYDLIQPDHIHLTTIDRTPPLKTLRSVSEKFLFDFADRIRRKGWRVDAFPARE